MQSLQTRPKTFALDCIKLDETFTVRTSAYPPQLHDTSRDSKETEIFPALDQHFYEARIKSSDSKKGKTEMKTILARMLTPAALNILLVASVAGQDMKNHGAATAGEKTNDSGAAAATTSIKNNGDLKLKGITLLYKSKDGVLQPAFGNYYVSSFATSVVFRVELDKDKTTPVKYRLQVRQVCPLKLTPDISIATKQEFLATTEVADGKDLNGTGKTFDLEIVLHPAPEGGVSHDPGSHCFDGDQDHLGEGPHQGFIAFGDGSLSSGSDSLHVFYTKEFETVNPDKLDLMRSTKLLELLRSLEPQAQPKGAKKRATTRGR
jgi:hypothetical protein